VPYLNHENDDSELLVDMMGAGHSTLPDGRNVHDISTGASGT
jgi:hypothetical protein